MKKIILLIALCLVLNCEIDNISKDETIINEVTKMAPTAKPDKVPYFATAIVVDGTTGTENVVEPPDSKKNSGWNFLEKPARNWYNWLHKKTYQWIDYFNQFFTAAGVFKINEINEFDAGSGVTVDGTNIKDGILTDDGSDGVGLQEVNGAILRTKIIEIGDWDMDTTPTLLVAHGLSDFKKVRGISVLIRSDSDSDYSIFNSFDIGSSEAIEQNIAISSTNIVMTRDQDGYFDSVNYNATSYNRGWITIQYID